MELLYEVFAIVVLFPAVIAAVAWIARKLETALYILGCCLSGVK